jgi:hypothetical protein
MNINSLKYRIVLGMFLVGVSLSLPAAASHGGGGHGGHGGGWHGGHGGGWHGGYGGGAGWWGMGLGVGLGWDAAYIADPYLDYPTPVYEQPYPIDAQPAPVAVQPPAQMWYYCVSAKGYYPYIPNCPEAWQQVPAVPPQGMPR